MDQKHRGNSSINPESTRTSYSRTSTASASIFGSEVFSISDLSTSCSAGMHSNEELLPLSQRWNCSTAPQEPRSLLDPRTVKRRDRVFSFTTIVALKRHNLWADA